MIKSRINSFYFVKKSVIKIKTDNKNKTKKLAVHKGLSVKIWWFLVLETRTGFGIKIKKEIAWLLKTKMIQLSKLWIQWSGCHAELSFYQNSSFTQLLLSIILSSWDGVQQFRSFVALAENRMLFSELSGTQTHMWCTCWQNSHTQKINLNNYL